MKNKVFLACLFCAVCILSAAADIKVYPNPWIPESGKSLGSDNDKMKHGGLTADGWIKFKGVETESGDLRIYDVAGNLVKSKKWSLTEENAVPLPQTNKETKDIVHWDGKDNYYKYVESGVYIWILREDGGKKYSGKVVVIR